MNMESSVSVPRLSPGITCDVVLLIGCVEKMSEKAECARHAFAADLRLIAFLTFKPHNLDSALSIVYTATANDTKLTVPLVSTDHHNHSSGASAILFKLFCYCLSHCHRVTAITAALASGPNNNDGRYIQGKRRLHSQYTHWICQPHPLNRSVHDLCPPLLQTLL